MNKQSKIACEEVRILMGVTLNFGPDSQKALKHFEGCTDCQEVWNEILRIKQMLKHAFAKESVPQSSIDFIKREIGC